MLSILSYVSCLNRIVPIVNYYLPHAPLPHDTLKEPRKESQEERAPS